MAKKSVAWTVGVVAVASALTAVARATPPSGVSAMIMARAAFADRVDVSFKVKDSHKGTEVIHVNGARDTVMQQIVLGPNGHTGWHSHPGPAVALVKSGELTIYSEEDPTCTGQTYSAGQAFVDSGQGHVHKGRNLSPSQNTEVWVTYFDVPPGGTVRIDAAAPGNCPF